MEPATLPTVTMGTPESHLQLPAISTSGTSTMIGSPLAPMMPIPLILQPQQVMLGMPASTLITSAAGSVATSSQHSLPSPGLNTRPPHLGPPSNPT